MNNFISTSMTNKFTVPYSSKLCQSLTIISPTKREIYKVGTVSGFSTRILIAWSQNFVLSHYIGTSIMRYLKMFGTNHYILDGEAIFIQAHTHRLQSKAFFIGNEENVCCLIDFALRSCFI